jgi:small-conductance mechanosensitive channel
LHGFGIFYYKIRYMETITSFFQQTKDYFDFKVFLIDGNVITMWNLLVAFFLIALLVIVVSKTTKILESKVFNKRKLDIGIRHAISTIIKYAVITIGTIIILSSAGINLSALTVLVGTLGVGIGFGLQSITSNFISGIIILFERPIKVGDRIEVGDTSGDVIKISGRATTILTNDNIAIIVPNSDFINKEVTNWSYNDRMVRFKIPISVAYSSDVHLVEKLLLDVANENPNVLKEPKPVVRFMSYEDSALNFQLRIWTSSLIHRQGRVISEINFGIFDKFKEHNIVVPFPQMDIRMKR